MGGGGRSGGGWGSSLELSRWMEKKRINERKNECREEEEEEEGERTEEK